MKYCVNCRQPKDVLEKVDEIFVEERDYRIVPELFVKYPNKTIILDYRKHSFDLQTLKDYAEASEDFVVKVYNLADEELLPFIKSNKIRFYYGYPVATFYEVNGLIDLGCEFIKVQEPLSFEMEKLSKLNAKFRMCPNIAYSAYIPRRDGVCGQWVRPEDVKFYEEGIYAFEFEDAELVKERTLFHIYAENGYWPGNLNLLLTNFGIDIDNRFLMPDLGERRANCGQRCQSRGTCHYCDLNIRFHNVLKSKLNEYKEAKKNEESEPTEG